MFVSESLWQEEKCCWTGVDDFFCFGREKSAKAALFNKDINTGECLFALILKYRVELLFVVSRLF